jgi:hypothetical protein
MEFLNFMMAIVALVVPLLFAWVVVNHQANKPPRKQERKPSK